MNRTKRGGAVLVALFAAFLVGGNALAADECLPDLEKPFGVMAEVKQVRREINLHNLFNGLHLTVGQMERILVQARKARQLRESYYGASSSRAHDVLKAYREILEVVRRGGRIPRPVEGMGVLMEFAEKRLAKRYFKSMNELEREVWKVLTPAQQDVFKGYEPCLIPPKKLKDPVRVGQADSHEEEKNILVLARRLPEETFEEECRRLLSVHLASLEKFLGRISAPERNRELDRMVAVCRRARPLSEVDFALKADDLAKELALGRQKDVIKAKAEEFFNLVRRFQGGSIGNVAKHFLDPLVISVLEGRIERAKNAPATEAKDLASVDGARPKNTKCALKPGEEGPGHKKKYGVGELCRILTLPGPTARKFREVIGKAKAAHGRILQIPMTDGRTPLERFLEIQKLPLEKRAAAGAELMQQLSEPIPHRDCSHLEYITRLQISLAKQLATVLTPAQYGKLEALVEDFLDHIEDGDKAKPHIREIAQKLGLTDTQCERVTRSLRRGQGEAFQILSIPNRDGKKPLQMILTAMNVPESRRGEAFQELLEALGQTIPGRDTTYQAELERIKAEVDRAFCEHLTPDQFRKYQAMALDILDIQLDED
ncbi:MAG: hypothetical protein ACYS47_12930 [Planctomycetota bacterium]|jgi:hypothetical protein